MSAPRASACRVSSRHSFAAAALVHAWITVSGATAERGVQRITDSVEPAVSGPLLGVTRTRHWSSFVVSWPSCPTYPRNASGWSRHSSEYARFELEVQTADAAQDVGRHVVVTAGAHGAVLLLGDPDVVHPVEQSLDRDPSLGARERSTGAGVRTVTERDVLARVRALHVEVARMLETTGVAVRGPVDDHECGARGD